MKNPLLVTPDVPPSGYPHSAAVPMNQDRAAGSDWRQHAAVCKTADLAYISAKASPSMNIFDKSFSPSEAQIRYLDADYIVLRPGSFVRCGTTGVPIPIDELTYWNVDRQEAYASAEAAHVAFKRYGLSGRL